MWRELAKPWQACLEALWRAWCAEEFNRYCIAAVIVDAAGCIVSTGVSHRLPLDRIRLMPEGPDGAHLREHVLAHAEMQALLSIDENRPTIRGRQCSLYTTLEPCPMCLGAVCMCNSIGQLHYASRDPWAGSSCLLDATPFLRRKRDRMRVIGPEHDPRLESVVAGLTLAMELCGGRHRDAPETQAAYGLLPTALATADALLSDDRVARWRHEVAPIADVLDATEQIVRRWLYGMIRLCLKSAGSWPNFRTSAGQKLGSGQCFDATGRHRYCSISPSVVAIVCLRPAAQCLTEAMVAPRRSGQA